MKIISIEYENIGPIKGRQVLEINQPLNILYGQVMAGKSTFIKGFIISVGGSYPTDLITHNQQNARVTVNAHDDATGAWKWTRSWYIGEDGKVKDRPIVLLIGNDPKPKDRPVERLKKYLNPFLLNQRFLSDMSEPARQRYFLDFLGVDTKEEDSEIEDLKEQAQALTLKIAGYGFIDLTEVLPHDKAGLQAKLAVMREDHDSLVATCNNQLDNLRQTENTLRGEVQSAETNIANDAADIRLADELIENLESRLTTAKNRRAQLVTTKAAHERERDRLKAELDKTDAAGLDAKEAEIKARRDAPFDTSELENQIAEATAQEVRVKTYQERVDKAAQRTKDDALLSSNGKRTKELQAAKAAKLAAIAEGCGIPGLSFDEIGNPMFEGCSMGMISSSQEIRLSKLVESRYPEGLGLQLLDGGESMGKAVFDLVARAKERNTSILVSVVGEKPAKLPADVGAWYVDDGKLLQ